MTEGIPRMIATASKDALRKLVPNFLLQQRDIVLRLGPRACRIYASLRLLDVLGVRAANQRLVPATTRSFLFVCHGNIMRSAKAGVGINVGRCKARPNALAKSRFGSGFGAVPLIGPVAAALSSASSKMPTRSA